MVAPSEIVDDADELRAQLLDTVGVALAGAGEGTVTTMRSITPHQPAGASLVNGGHSDAVAAAYHNAVAAHVLDFDDTHSNSLVHTSAVVVPVLSSIAESIDTTYGKMLTAYRLGIRMTGFLEALGPALNGAGVHATAVIGAISGAAAGGWLLTGDADVASDAAHLAAGMSLGLCANFGRDAKSLQVGNSAAVATRAALLAEHGTGAGDTIFGSTGVFARTLGQPADDFVRWDDPCIDALRVLDIKPYPCCYLIRPAIDLARQAHQHLAGADPTSIHSVEIQIGPLAAELADQDPVLDSAMALKFSVRYCVAAALLTGNVTVDAIRRPREVFEANALESLLARTKVVVDPDLPPTRSRLSLGGGAADATGGTYETAAAAEKLSIEGTVTKFLDTADTADGASIVDAIMGAPLDAPFISHWAHQRRIA